MKYRWVLITFSKCSTITDFADDRNLPDNMTLHIHTHDFNRYVRIPKYIDIHIYTKLKMLRKMLLFDGSTLKVIQHIPFHSNKNPQPNQYASIVAFEMELK